MFESGNALKGGEHNLTQGGGIPIQLWQHNVKPLATTMRAPSYRQTANNVFNEAKTKHHGSPHFAKEVRVKDHCKALQIDHATKGKLTWPH